MSDKISPFEVVKEALSVGWARKWTFSGITCLQFLPMLLFILVMTSMESFDLTMLTDISSTMLMAISSTMFVVNMFVVLVAVTAGCHLAVTAQRGEGRVSPDFWIKALWQVFIRGLLIWLVMFGITALAVGLIAGAIYFFSPEDGQDFNGVVSFLVILFIFVVNIVLFGSLMRLGIIIPGASVGHKISLSESFVMTRHHAWRMLWSYAIISIPVVVVILGCAVATDAIQSIWVGIAITSLIVIGDIVISVFLLVTLCVWYEKLRLRREAMNFPELIMTNAK